MRATLQLLLRYQVKQKSAGFTLIELLVGLIIAVLVMVPLLGLAINLISTDRREQAKATTEQDMQTAVDFIARDLQQAIYLYDSVALTEELDEANPEGSGILNQIPPVSGAVSNCKDANTCIPVLAFWTRRVVENASPISGQEDNVCKGANQEQFCDDTFVYSLVVYYLILEDGSSDIWSDEARIGRFEVSAGVTNSADSLIAEGDSLKYRDDGYAPFDLALDGEDIRSKMNRWGKESDDYSSNSLQILVDHVDATNIDDISSGEELPKLDCPAPIAPADGSSQDGWLQSPYYGDYSDHNPKVGVTTPKAFQTYSFYACLNSEQSIAKIYLRGNALSRLRPNADTFYREGSASLFPVVSAEVQLEGRLVQ